MIKKFLFGVMFFSSTCFAHDKICIQINDKDVEVEELSETETNSLLYELQIRRKTCDGITQAESFQRQNVVYKVFLINLREFEFQQTQHLRKPRCRHFPRVRQCN